MIRIIITALAPLLALASIRKNIFICKTEEIVRKEKSKLFLLQMGKTFSLQITMNFDVENFDCFHLVVTV